MQRGKEAVIPAKAGILGKREAYGDIEMQADTIAVLFIYGLIGKKSLLLKYYDHNA
jgi:hypothetical protein